MVKVGTLAGTLDISYMVPMCEVSNKYFRLLKLFLGRKISPSITDNVCMYYNTFGHCAFIFFDDCNMCSAKH